MKASRATTLQRLAYRLPGRLRQPIAVQPGVQKHVWQLACQRLATLALHPASSKLSGHVRKRSAFRNTATHSLRLPDQHPHVYPYRLTQGKTVGHIMAIDSGVSGGERLRQSLVWFIGPGSIKGSSGSLDSNSAVGCVSDPDHLWAIRWTACTRKVTA